MSDSQFDNYLDNLTLRFTGFTYTPEQARRIFRLVIDMVCQGISPTNMKARGLGLTNLSYVNHLLTDGQDDPNA